MVRDCTFMQMELNILGFGEMIYNTVEVKKLGLMDLVFKATI